MKRIISSVICLFMFGAVLSFSSPKAYADLTWTCMEVHFNTYNSENGIIYHSETKQIPYSNFSVYNGRDGVSAYCTSANITGSVSAAITEAEKQDIANRIINSTRLQNIEGYLDGTKNGGKSLAAAYDRANAAAANAANAKTSADAAKAAAERPDVFRVVKGQAFSEIMYGEINGTSGGVTASSTAGSGYTTITGTLSTAGVQTITIGGKALLFKVVEAPTTSYKAAVSFSE